MNTAQKGFSLVEILVVTVIAGLIILAVANLVPAISLIGSGNHELIAKEVAAQKIEDIRTLGYDNLGNGSSVISDSRLNPLNQASAAATISDCSPTICTNGELLKEVVVSISWMENSKPKTFQVATFVAKGGLK
jgi:prepilin-type N-terminal cleavage/methylation domain-containing protein